VEEIQPKSQRRDLTQRRPSQELLEKKFPEWILFEKLIDELGPRGHVHNLGYSRNDEYDFPLTALSFGNHDPEAPTLLMVGGVHGLERIGAQVVLSFLQSFSELILWDKTLHNTLEKIRIIFFPMVNPIGIMNVTRSNPAGVDLMRNAPVETPEKTTFLLGGQRISNKLPWYRGPHNAPPEPESEALLKLVKELVLPAKVALSVDFHSGFGVVDRLWFPYSRTNEPFPHLPEMFTLKKMFDRTYPNHIYRVEPQASSYTITGDLWDYSYDLYNHSSGTDSSRVYIPMCLEMGSWAWIRKNPLQLFSSLGPFNPIKPHRQKRILRRHITLFDFLTKALVSHEAWTAHNLEQRKKYEQRALEAWYDRE
jgi:hypothetical protein